MLSPTSTGGGTLIGIMATLSQGWDADGRKTSQAIQTTRGGLQL